MKILAILLGLAATAAAQTLIGWNNLGMHCMDDDYSVFSILPPYNTVDCQLIDAQGRLVTDPTGLVVTYEAVADPDGSINTSSIGKTNFWQYSPVLFNAPLPPDYGLPFPEGNPGRNMPGASNTPQAMGFDGAMRWFEAAGIPITPVDDAGQPNPYPLMRLTAKTTGGTVLATTDVVLPVSGEMDCRACHASGSGDAAKPANDWVNDPDSARDHRLNILRLHDRHLGTQPYDDALAAKGYPNGLEASVRDDDKPVLCAACHASEALGSTSFAGVKSLTRSMHSKHAEVKVPGTIITLDDITNRSSCYQCHPGSETSCLRGAMGAAVAPDGSAAMQCQSCHGTMSQVGAANRTGWLDEPNCGSCHTGTATQNRGELRYDSVFDETTGEEREPLLDIFSSNPDTPAAGISLYRFSKGHGDLQCSACHGSTHAIFPSAHRNDNLQNIAAQGHAGTRSDCTSCHAMPAISPSTASGGPHGMHPTGTEWIAEHKEYGESSSCLGCHGADLRGTPLSRSFSDQTLSFVHDETPHDILLFRGANVSCFLCHKREDNGDPGGLFNNNARPVVTNKTLVTEVDTPGNLTLGSNEPGATLRIVRQPQHGRVGLAGNVATYFPDDGFAGADSFAYAAFDGFADSNLGMVSVTVGNPANSGTLDSDGDQWPDLVEYALGLTIGYRNAPISQKMAFRDLGGTRYWTMSLPRGPAPGDASAAVDFSSDLIHWEPGVTLTNAPFLLEVRDPFPAAGQPKRFTRIRASR